MTFTELQALVNFLEQHITQNKAEQIKRVLPERTHYITIALEDTYQSHNASAIIRSCEIFGVQNIHAVEDRNQFVPTMGISKGALKWVDIHRYNSTKNCLETLKNQGYSIVATVPDANAIPINKLPLDKKIALVFGTELVGLTQEALSLADATTYIPMYGFTNSFNVSVSAALCLQSITERLRASTIDWKMSKEEQLNLKLSWLRKIISGADQLENHFFKNKTLL